jgi:hypothetical protein
MDSTDADDSSSTTSWSADSVDSGWTTAVTTPREKPEEERTGGGVMETVLLLLVKLVLAGVQGAVVLEWLLRTVLEALIWLVELGMLLVQPPN